MVKVKDKNDRIRRLSWLNNQHDHCCQSIVNTPLRSLTRWTHVQSHKSGRRLVVNVLDSYQRCTEHMFSFTSRDEDLLLARCWALIKRRAEHMFRLARLDDLLRTCWISNIEERCKYWRELWGKEVAPLRQMVLIGSSISPCRPRGQTRETKRFDQR